MIALRSISRNRNLPWLLLFVGAVGIVIGAAAQSRTQWEYGQLANYSGRIRWTDGISTIKEESAPDTIGNLTALAKKLDLSPQGSADYPEISVFNALGKLGWEVMYTDHPEAGQTRTYFKRVRQ